MEVAIGVGSLVLLAGGLTAAVRRTIRPGQAAAVAGIAVAVAAIALFASWIGDNGLYHFAVVAPTALAGIVMAVSVVSRPTRRAS
jgi:peptidoglycan/LPS O-acetylase OafA/YrhL